MSSANQTPVRSWKKCAYCTDSGSLTVFKSPREFSEHLRERHCTREGGSFICRYGFNGVCSSLPVDGVSDRDYEDHVARNHILVGVINKLNVGTKQKRAKDSVIEDNNNVYASGCSSMNATVATSKETNCQPNIIIDQLDAHERGVLTRHKDYHKVNPDKYNASLEAKNAISNQPNIVRDQFKWSVYNCGQNLPAVLNDPRRVKREVEFFTKTWGESFYDKSEHIRKSPHLMNVERHHFDMYLRQTTKRHRRHLRRTAQIAALKDPDKQDRAVASLTNLQISDSNDKQEYDIDSIPKLYLQSGFDLKDQETFQAVLPWSHIGNTSSSSSSSKLLQEKLAHYLDIVEVHIAKQILLRSDAFFHAMSSHDELTDQLEMTVRAVKHLRDKIHKIDNVLVKGSLQIMQLSRSRSNYFNVYKKLKLMATVHQTQATIQFLLSTSDFVGALDLIYTSRDVLSQELAGIQSLRHLSSQLIEIERVIDKVMDTEFLKYITADLNRPLTEDGTKVMQEERLIAIIFGQLRLKRLSFIDVYKNEACTAIKAVIKQTVIEAVSLVDDLNDDNVTANLADQMRMLKFTQWLELLDKLFSNLKLILKRIKAVHDIMREAVTVATGKSRQSNKILQSNSDVNVRRDSISLHLTEDADPVVMTSSDYDQLHKSLDDLLYSVCDYSHDRCSKLLSARAKDGFMDKLTPQEFILISQNIEKFIRGCSETCGRTSTSLRLTLRTQAAKIVNKFHDERKIKLSLILDNERWKQADVPTEFQNIVDHISQTGVLSLPKKSLNDTGSERKPAEFLFVNGDKFAVVGTVLLLLKMLVEYCQFVNDIPSITPELLTLLVDLLKIFNSKTCQLVLGAGAVQLVGLKTITTKNLALASRCLQLVLFYIPKVGEYFESNLKNCKQQQSVGKNISQIVNDYTNHVKEIQTKLVNITGTMIENQLNKWVVRAPVPSSSFKTIGKQLSRVYDAISDILTADDVYEIFRLIHALFKDRLRRQIIRLNVCNDGGPQHGLVTQELTFYSENLKSLKLSFDLELDDIWTTR